ncbi:hypothetical protein I4U23_031476 [Adineta vaga]|nr:hypothetical protein I4U23_031476 [Adineta vaga]
MNYELFSLVSIDDQNRLLNGKPMVIEKYSEFHRHPQIYIKNSLRLFWEKLELHHFPHDIQDLSLSITSTLYHDKVFGVNLEAFVDQQEWFLYEHVDFE